MKYEWGVSQSGMEQAGNSKNKDGKKYIKHSIPEQKEKHFNKRTKKATSVI